MPVTQSPIEFIRAKALRKVLSGADEGAYAFVLVPTNEAVDDVIDPARIGKIARSLVCTYCYWEK